MKRFLIVLFLFTTFSGKTQLNPFTFGVLFTGNGTMLDAKPKYTSVEPQIGYGVTAFARLKILFLYAELEAGYAGHSVNTVQEVSGTKSSYGYSLKGLDLSGILGWRVIGIGKLGNFRLFTGYNFNNYTSIEVSSGGSQVKDPSINTGNSGIIFGTGVDIWKFILNVKYIMGITDLSSSNTQELKTNFAAVSIGFKF